MDRRQYDDYKNIIRETFNMLVQKYDLPLRIASIGITPAKEAVTVSIEDTGVIRFLNDKYGSNWPLSLSKAHVLTIDFTKGFYDHDPSVADRIMGIDVNESHDVKVRCRIGHHLIRDWKAWRDGVWPDIPLKN
jgi:hypothetical protein